MDKEQVIRVAREAAAARGCFLVEVVLSAENDMEIVIEKTEGSVDWDDCAAVDKALGQSVDVKFKGGRRLVATLEEATPESVTLRFVALEAVEGKKKKEKVEHCDRFPLTEINSVTPYIEFK